MRFGVRSSSSPSSERGERARPVPGGRLLGALDAHRWLVLVLALAAGLRVAVAIVYRPALFYGDSWDYLNMAYMAFPAGGSSVRPSGYPVLIRALSLAGHHLAVITTAQHLAGLAVGVLLYMLLTRRGVARWLAAVATAIALLDLYAITLEQTILTEAFFTLALFASVYIAICAAPTSPALLLSGGLLAAASLMRVAGTFAFPAWFLYLVWRRAGLRRLVVGLLAFALPLVAYAGAQHHVTGRFSLVESNGWFQYARVAQIAYPCGHANVPPPTRYLCERQGHVPGAGPGFYLFNGASPARRRFRGPTAGSHAYRRRTNRLMHEFAVAIVRERPFKYATLVWSDFSRYFEPGVRSGGSRAEDLPTKPETLPDPFAAGVRKHYFPGLPPRRFGSGSFLPRLERWLHTPRWLMALFALCGVVSSASAVLRRGRRSAGNRAEVAFLVGAAVMILLGSAATSAFILRYLIPEVPLFVCGGVLALRELMPGRASPLAETRPEPARAAAGAPR